MLLYAAENFAAVAFAASVAISSKYIFRVAIGIGKDGRPLVRHFLNPSNFGITVTLLLFPTVGIAPPFISLAPRTPGALSTGFYR